MQYKLSFGDGSSQESGFVESNLVPPLLRRNAGCSHAGAWERDKKSEP